VVAVACRRFQSSLLYSILLVCAYCRDYYHYHSGLTLLHVEPRMAKKASHWSLKNLAATEAAFYIKEGSRVFYVLRVTVK
jgi:hypothetical protein